MGMSIGPREPALHAGRRPRLDGESGPILHIYRLAAGETCVAADRASAETAHRDGESEPNYAARASADTAHLPPWLRALVAQGL
jgi:hypothetical protein